MSAPALSELDRDRVEVILQRVGVIAEDLREEYREILEGAVTGGADAPPAEAPATT